MTSENLPASQAPSSALEEFLASHGGAIPGLETVESDDVSLAIIKIDHKTGTFVDSLTGQSYSEIDGVLLGLLKQRIMWDTDLSAKNGLMCKSRDAKIGTPRESFPWAKFKERKGVEPVGSDEIACATCPFAEWGSHPQRDSSWCALQYTFPVVVGTDSNNVTGLLSLQRSGVKPAKSYVSGFIRDAIPMFSVRTTITLTRAENGGTVYYTPKFARGEAVEDVEAWKQWASDWGRISKIVSDTDIRGDVVIGDPDAVEGAVVAPAAAAEPVEPAF